VLKVPQVVGVRYHDRADGAEAPDDFSRVGKAPHMGIAGGEISIWYRKARILLDREEQFRHGLIKAPRQEMGRA
jgi:hypothetical protein